MEEEYQESFDWLLNQITEKKPWYLNLLLHLRYGRTRANRIQLLEKERLFWLNEAMEWHAIRVASRPEQDFDTFERAERNFLFCKNRHSMVCDELELS